MKTLKLKLFVATSDHGSEANVAAQYMSHAEQEAQSILGSVQKIEQTGEVHVCIMDHVLENLVKDQS